MGEPTRQRKTGVTQSKSSPVAGGKCLPPSFYAQPTEQIARHLIGQCLFFKTNPKQCEWVGGRILETEAYWGDDPASHSACGLTARNFVMFGPPGRAYVYLIYGMYPMLNITTEAEGEGGAVLIRALEPLRGHELMHLRRKSSDLASGPGKLCQALGIQMKHNGLQLQEPHFWIGSDDFAVSSVSVSPRIGIRHARERELRFFLTGHPGVSRVRENRQARIL